MIKIKTPDDLLKMQEENQAKMDAGIRENAVRIRVAMATCGIASGAKEVMDYLSSEMEKRHIAATISKVGCMGYCYAEPTIEVTLPGQLPVVFGEVDITKADQIIEKYIRQGVPVEGIIPLNYETIDN